MIHLLIVDDTPEALEFITELLQKALKPLKIKDKNYKECLNFPKSFSLRPMIPVFDHLIFAGKQTSHAFDGF